MRAKGPEFISFFGFGRYSLITSIPKVETRKTVLFRNAYAANLCKCKKWCFAWGRLRQMALTFQGFA